MQLLGAFCAGMIVYGLYRGPLELFELQRNITRGQLGSQASAAFLCEYFPNPGSALTDASVSIGTAFGVEILGSLLLMLVILALTDRRNVT